MKTLFLFRHAKTAWAKPGQDDHERPLKRRGQKDARDLGRYLEARAPKLDVALCSSARRAVDSWQLAVTEMSLPPHTYIEKGLYLCGPETLLRRAQDLPEEVNSAIIIAHNPDLHILTMDLGARGGENLAALAHGFPTAGLARLEFATDSWSEISGSNDILLVDFVSPRILANHDAMAGGLEAEK